MADLGTFSPNAEKEIARKRRMAEILMQQGQMNPTQMAGGLVVPISPLEALSKGFSTAYGHYQQGKADSAEQDLEARRQALMADALAKMSSGDTRTAAMTLAQDPKNQAMAMQLMGDANTAEMTNAKEDKKFQQQLAMQDRQFQKQLEAAAVRSGKSVYDPSTGQIVTNQEPKPVLSATEQKQFFANQEKAQSVDAALAALNQVDKLKGEGMFTGAGSTAIAGANRVPLLGAFIDDQKAANTTAYNNSLKELAYSRLKETFPGAISNSEREALEKLQALSSYSPAEQTKILETARAALTRKKDVYSGNLQGLATGNVYSNAAKAPNVQTDKVRAHLQSKGLSEEAITKFLQSRGL